MTREKNMMSEFAAFRKNQKTVFGYSETFKQLPEHTNYASDILDMYSDDYKSFYEKFNFSQITTVENIFTGLSSIEANEGTLIYGKIFSYADVNHIIKVADGNTYTFGYLYGEIRKSLITLPNTVEINMQRVTTKPTTTSKLLAINNELDKLSGFSFKEFANPIYCKAISRKVLNKEYEYEEAGVFYGNKGDNILCLILYKVDISYIEPILVKDKLILNMWSEVCAPFCRWKNPDLTFSKKFIFEDSEYSKNKINTILKWL